MTTNEELPARIRSGVRLGLRVATLFSVLALIAFLLGGNAVLARKSLPPIERLLVVYYLGGASAGAIGGWLGRWARSDARAALVGIVAALPMSLLFRIASDGLVVWGPRNWFLFLVWAIVIGSGCGIITRRVGRSK